MDNKKKNKDIFFVIYDGIANSVFHSQVLSTILKILDMDKDSSVTLISFEKDKISQRSINNIVAGNSRIKMIIKKRLPFIGKFSLRGNSSYLQKMISKVGPSKIFARGPFAAWIVMSATKSFCKDSSMEIILQARGLAAEEFLYVIEKSKEKSIKSRIKNFLYNKYKLIEKMVYSSSNKNLRIESVSFALKEYIVKEFKADSSKIFISDIDRLSFVEKEKISYWRSMIRKKLNISDEKYVYCYSGSARPWQHVDYMIDFALLESKDEKNFFLFISQDKDIFLEKLSIAGVPRDRYVVLSVAPDQIYMYLSCADAGLLFREACSVNWVSRPTKMLEYQSVGLKVIHNNTIECLCGK